MDMHFKCRIPILMEVKEEYSVSKELEDVIKERNKTIADVIMERTADRFL